MYMLFVDESGTHGGSPSFVLGAIAIHEDDAERLQHALDSLVVKHLKHVPPNLEEYELHAGEMRNAKKPKASQGGKSQKVSIWAGLDRKSRLSLLAEAYSLLSTFEPTNSDLAPVLFGVVISQHFHTSSSQVEKERFAYEVLLNKFDVMLKSARLVKDLPNRGIVIHDRRVVAERDIQTWTSEWRKAAGTLGQLKNLAEIPLFADSRATRLLQAADLVSYALYRRYDPSVHDPSYLDAVWPLFHRDGGTLHGCVHYTPEYGRGSCDCAACEARQNHHPLPHPRNAKRSLRPDHTVR